MLAWHTFSFFEIVLVENEVISRCALLLCCCRRRPCQVGLVNYEVCQARGSDCLFNIFFHPVQIAGHVFYWLCVVWF